DPLFESRPASANLLQRLLRAINRALYLLIGSAFESAARHPAILISAVVAMLLAALGLFVVLVAPRLRRRRAATQPAGSPLRGAPEASGAIALLARAEREAAAGRLGEALRLLEQAAVVALRARGAVPALPGLTDLEGVEALRRRG